ncbi:hypothetical protein [Halalkalibacter nanhaiisediminis]|uniref:Uncharacterized protein n=1 Tax=Halalkalibacter nanhaiisediminis TaxID=688079 RepID=A0A562QMW6_9BACI|nr:hypothetical protein [Halalkalibacter nanhaiisediminis]TWI58084.1 hypothetical protein IQ10_01415 [Halalkalibacter nanhaiisediminis]
MFRFKDQATPQRICERCLTTFTKVEKCPTCGYAHFHEVVLSDPYKGKKITESKVG